MEYFPIIFVHSWQTDFQPFATNTRIDYIDRVFQIKYSCIRGKMEYGIFPINIRAFVAKQTFSLLQTYGL